MLRPRRFAARVLTVTVGVVALAMGPASVVFGKPGDITVSVIGCTTARVSASGFPDDVDVVNWSIDSTDSSDDRSGQLQLGDDGAASIIVEPDLGPGSYRLTWSHPWRGNADREGTITFTISRCSSGDPTTSPSPTTESPTGSPTPTDTPTASNSSPDGFFPSITPTSFPTSLGSAGRRPSAAPASGGGLTMGEVASLALVTIGSTATAVVIWRRRRPVPRHRKPGWWD